MEDFLRQALMMSGINASSKDLQAIAVTMMGLLEASAPLTFFQLTDVVPALLFDAEVAVA
ncbi:hypothetical protein [Desulfofundulus sp.]|uniref:hypothetical protein n=1 Tax=Desulfofundulus sp. TaxID=2282750 RepID=UPI003C70741D